MSLRKELIYSSGALIFSVVTKGTPPNGLAWRPAWFRIAIPQYYIFAYLKNDYMRV